MEKRIDKVLAAFRDAGVNDAHVNAHKLFDMVALGRLSDIDLTKFVNDDDHLERVAQRRGSGEPLEYIIGLAVFMDRLFACTPETLIPRKDTELLVRTAVSLAQVEGADPVLIEIGTGCGNIAVSIAARLEGATIHASDISESAVEVAHFNVDRYGLLDRITLACGDLFEPFRGTVLEGEVDMVVCNPPYIPSSSLERLDAEIVEYEPLIALNAGSYGIDIFRRLIADSLDFLKPGGILVFEMGAGQERLVERLFNRSGRYVDIGRYHHEDLVRVMSARRRGD